MTSSFGQTYVSVLLEGLNPYWPVNLYCLFSIAMQLLAADAFNIGLGVILLQIDGARLNRSVAYFSKKLTNQAYLTTEKESLKMKLKMMLTLNCNSDCKS